MPVERTTIVTFDEIKNGTREAAADDLNFRANEHVTTARNLASVDKGTMRRSIRQIQRATPRRLQAIVRGGGEEAPYIGLQNYGYHTSNGGYVPGLFFWEEGEEAAMIAQFKGPIVHRERGGSRLRTFVETEVGEVGYER
jgi:hypothetical protein